MSWVNTAEAEVTLMLVRHLLDEYGELMGPGCADLGIVTPYAGQVQRIRETLARELDGKAIAKLEVHTVDGFQGREKEAIIFSCVRAGRGPGGVGFLADNRRLNVGLTRAKSLLIVLGSSRRLARDKTWAMLMASAKDRGRFVPVTNPASAWFDKAILAQGEEHLAPSSL